MKQDKITTAKMPGETEQQYMAWLLYCEAGSIPRMIRAWEQVRQGIGETSGIWREKLQKLGKLPAERNIEKWSSKYKWVERKELKLTEDLKSIRERSEKIKQEKLHKIAEAFERVTNKILKRLREGEEPTINEWKQVWEMLRTELGESIGKHEVGINEYEQKPPEYNENIEPVNTLAIKILECLVVYCSIEKKKKAVTEFAWLIQEMTDFTIRKTGFSTKRKPPEQINREILERIKSAWKEIREDFYSKEDIKDWQRETEREIQTELERLISYPEDKKEYNPLLKH